MYLLTKVSTSCLLFDIIQASPLLSYFGLPALPIICLISMTEIGIFVPARVFQRLWSRITTLLAGKFTPCAKVGVATMQFMSPLLNAFSIFFLCLLLKPAWWKPMPPLSENFNFFPNADFSSLFVSDSDNSSHNAKCSSAYILFSFFDIFIT